MREYGIWLLKLITIFVLVIFASAVAGRVAQMGDLEENTRKIGVVELVGVIVEPKDVLEQLSQFEDDEEIDGIVLRIDSPGGAVAPSQEIFRTVQRITAKKPVVASMGAVAASGGLYASLAASKVFAQPGTLTGSIGVIVQIPNFAKVAENFGVSMVTVKSGKFKDVGNSFREMTEEERQFLQSTIDTVHQQFVQDLATSRKLEPSAVREFADGRVIVGARAKELGLVDDFGGLREASRAVFEILGQPLGEQEQPKLVYPEGEFESFTKLFEASEKVVQIVHGIRPSSLQLMYLMD